MAEDRSVGGLFLRLGLSLSELETGFVNAQQTIAANINRLNREAELVRIRSEIEIAGLDETADAERILQVRQEALNRQMEIQRDRVRILDAELQNLIRTQGENSVAAQRATTTLERARLALANMEREARNLNDSSGETNSIFGELNDMLPSMPTKLQAVGMAFGAITAGIGAAGAAVNELREEFKELQNQAYELNMPVPDTRKFLREMRLAGGDIGDFEGYIRGITDAWVKGEYDDPEFIALRKYGAEITDATGRLKDFKDITEEVYQAWLRADAAGEGIEFLQLTGGEAGVRDAIQYFQRLKEAREDAAKIFQAELNDKQLHEFDREMNLVEEQSKELKAALGDIFIPAAQSAAENFFNVLHDGTEYLVENKNEIQRWGYITTEVFETIGNKVGDFVDKLGEIAKTPKGTTGNAEVDKMMSGLGWRYQDFNQQKPWGVNTQWDKFNEETRKSYGIFSDEVERADEKLKALNDTFNATTTVSDKVAKGLAALKDKNPLNQYDWKRINAFREELEDLRIELDYDDDAYKKALAQLDLWRERERGAKNFLSDEEGEAIDKLYFAKLEQIEKEHAEEIAKAQEEAAAKIQEYWKNAADIEYELTHTAFEKQIRDIEQWEQAQRQKAETAEEIAGIVAESAAKEAQAFEREMDRIKDKLQSLDDKIFEIDHSQYENDLRRIQQEYLKQVKEYQDLGALTPEVKAQLDYLFSRQKQNLDLKAKQGGDYTKRPEGAMQRGGNGISVIEGDQIVDDGLQQRQINLMSQENRIREQLTRNLDDDARATLKRLEATKALTDAQKDLLPQTPTTNGYQVIEGDEVVSNPQTIEGEQTISGLREFDSALQGAATTLEQFNQPVEDFHNLSAAIAQSESDFQASLKRMAENLPADYFKTLADNSKAVSEMQLGLTKSTMELIDAQSELKAALKDFPKTIPTNNQQSAKELMNLSTQGQLNPQVSDIPRQQSNGFNFGFDWDVFGGLAGLAALIPHPAAKALAIGGAIGAGAGAGTFLNQSETPSLQPAMPNIDLTGITTALSGIDTTTQSILQQIETPKETMPVETIVTPLNNIATITGNILSALGNRKPAQVTVSPSISNNLGGAYVFDNSMKAQLVNDITSNIVDAITRAVEQATSQSNYSFGA